MRKPSLQQLGSACLLLAQAHASCPVSQPEPGLIENKEQGFICARLETGEFVTVYLHGATITSWMPRDGEERIFLSTASKLDGSDAIRGGIPIVFPNFASPPKEGQTSKLTSHGFARNTTWTFADHELSSGTGTPRAKLKFTLDTSSLNDFYRAKWPYSAKLTYHVILEESKLSVKFSWENTDKEALDFQFLLHTYLTTPDINQTTVAGLAGSQFVDKIRNGTVSKQDEDELAITGPTDRIYSPPKVEPLVLKVNDTPRVTVNRDKELPDVTIWNVWADKIQTISDFAPKDAWKHYLAVEPGAVAKFQKLEPGKSWSAGVVYEAND